MFDAHRLIAQGGLDAARRAAASKFERACVDAAAAVLTPSAKPDDVIYAGPEVVSLPHRRLDGRADALSWSRRIGASVYGLESGRNMIGAPAGVPFGSKGRLLLTYLHDAAIRGASPVVDVGAPMRAWMRALGGEVGGMTYRRLSEQLTRIIACKAEIIEENLQPRFVHRGPLVARVLSEDPGGVPATLRLDASFHRYITAKPIALRATALGQIRDNGWAIDLYVWLSFHLPILTEPLLIDWPSFVLSFDSGYKHGRQMKATSVLSLPLVKAIYPEAGIEVTEEYLVLHPSPPPVRAPTAGRAS